MIIRAYGIPVAQGSKKGFVSKSGRVSIVDQSGKKLTVWRDILEDATLKAMDGREPLDGDLHATVVLWMPKPKTVKRKHPNVKPDIDKTLRAVFDGLTTGGAYVDDARIVRVTAEKRYADDLEKPGALITISICE